MSTTPPPAPYPATPQVSPEPAQPRLSEPARLINVFFAPRKTFEDLTVNASWWVPWMVSAIFTVLLALAISQKVDLPHVVEHRVEQSKFAQARMEQLTDAQRERAMGMQVTIAKVGYFLRPVLSLLGGLIAAAVLMAVFNFGFAAEIPFSRALAIFFYASLPGVVKSILLSISLFASSGLTMIDPDINPIATNPAFFMDREANKFFYGLASGLDVFVIWTLILIGFGFAIASKNKKLSTGTAISTVAAIYAVVVLVFAAIGAAV